MRRLEGRPRLLGFSTGRRRASSPFAYRSWSVPGITNLGRFSYCFCQVSTVSCAVSSALHRVMASLGRLIHCFGGGSGRFIHSGRGSNMGCGGSLLRRASHGSSSSSLGCTSSLRSLLCSASLRRLNQFWSEGSRRLFHVSSLGCRSSLRSLLCWELSS